jgi:Tol biopolymer transport system component
VWFDRQGKPIGSLGPSSTYNGLSLSPDGKRVAVEDIGASGNWDIWMIDPARAVSTRFTFDPGQDWFPVWSPDSNRLVFSSDRGNTGTLSLYLKNVATSTPEELLYPAEGSGSLRASDWSPDGNSLLFSKSNPTTRQDLWVLTNPGGNARERKKEIYLQTPFDDTQGQFSPDGHWVAYTSDASGVGQYHVYVQSFPRGNGEFQISTGPGGMQPRWRRDGKELFYLAPDGTLMSVDVKTTPRFEVGTPKPLFDSRITTVGSRSITFHYAVSADGQRFLTMTNFNPADSAAAEPIAVILNWQAAGKR